MRKKLFVFTVVAALLISMLPTNSIFCCGETGVDMGTGKERMDT